MKIYLRYGAEPFAHEHAAERVEFFTQNVAEVSESFGEYLQAFFHNSLTLTEAEFLPPSVHGALGDVAAPALSENIQPPAEAGDSQELIVEAESAPAEAGDAQAALPAPKSLGRK